MNRREGLGALLGLAATRFANSATPLDNLSPQDDASLDEVLSEIESLGTPSVETVRAIDVIQPDRSVLAVNAMRPLFTVPPLTADTIKKLKARTYWMSAAADRPPVTWPRLDKAPDYSHLSALPLSPSKFDLTAGVLKTLADNNLFNLASTRPVVVFGLRGCVVANDASSGPWAATHSVEAVVPNHIDSRCIVGLWRRSDDQLMIFQASTVPSVAHMYTSLVENGAGTSLLPTGLYQYSVGTHLASKPASIQQGALRIMGEYVVLRTAKDLSYDPFAATTAWTRGAAHNIHAGGSSNRPNSAGCQVIPGGYTGEGRSKSTGEWSSFQRAAGLVDSAGVYHATNAGVPFIYMLLTGTEAALAYRGGPAFNNGYRRLRPGSQGPEVTSLQTRLVRDYGTLVEGLKVTGIFDMRTAFAVLLDAKRRSQEFTTPVVAI